MWLRLVSAIDVVVSNAPLDSLEILFGMNMYFGKKSQKLILLLWGICLAVSLVIMIPFIRYSLIDFVESLFLDSPSGRSDYWAQLLLGSSIAVAILSSILFGGAYWLITFPYALKLRNNIKVEFIEWKTESVPVLLARKTIICFFIISVILLVAFSALLRANFNYIDDMGRVFTGATEWGGNFFRWVLYLENIFAQMNLKLADASPLNQFIAIFILTASVVVVAYIFSGVGKKVTERKELLTGHIIASLLIAFNPYFLECMSYKFESVGMASSVLFSFIPFLFVSHKHLFFISSFISVFLMCLSYQASSGIYIMMVIIVGLLWFLNNDGKTVKEIIIFVAGSAVSYLLATGFFYILSIFLTSGSYRLTRIQMSLDLITFISNLRSYINIILKDFTWFWLVLCLIIMIFAIRAIVMNSKKGKVLALFLSLICLAIAFIFSYGAYLFLQNFASSPRMVYGVGIFIAIMANCAVISSGRRHNLLSIVPIILLVWCFFSYCFVYGNSLHYQSEYERHYEDMILDDLNNLFSNQTEQYELMVSGSIGYSPIVSHVNDIYPINSRLVPIMLAASTWHWGGYRLARYYSDSFDKVSASFRYDIEEYNLVKSSMAYDILQNGNSILIQLK